MYGIYDAPTVVNAFYYAGFNEFGMSFIIDNNWFLVNILRYGYCLLLYIVYLEGILHSPAFRIGWPE